VIRLRAYRPADAEPLAALYERAVRIGAAGAYSPAQLAARATGPEGAGDWAERLGGQITVVAERGGVPVGFMTLGHDGHLDLAFVAPEAKGTGVAAALHDRILAEAQARGMAQLTTEASHPARRFFLKQGWREIAAQEVALRGARLTNFRMEKPLSAGPVRPGARSAGV